MTAPLFATASSAFATPTRALTTSLVGGCALFALTATLMPSGVDLQAAMRRAASSFAAPAPPSALAAARSARTPAVLAAEFAQGKSLGLAELKWLLASSTASADLATLSAITRRIEEHEPVSTARVTWDILAGNRPAVAHAFLEQRADRATPGLWQLRFDLSRRAGDPELGRTMVRNAATHPGSAPPAQLIAAAYAVDLPEEIITAAEHGAIPQLDRTASLDLARRAVAAHRAELLARIDRVGDPAWRGADPWLALTLARDRGDYPAALRYAAMLPSGREDVRQALIVASGDRTAIRAMLLEQAASGGNHVTIAQQMLEHGMRADAIALLKADSASSAPTDPAATRLLNLMGPRPDAAGLQWLRGMADRRADWRAVYLDRERPAAALAYLAGQPDADSTAGLIRRLRLASAAHDRASGTTLVSRLLDGRPLTASDIAAIESNAPSALPSRLTLALSQTRLAAGVGQPQDRLDLAWDAWNHNRPDEARATLATYLQQRPNDRAALRLMAAIERKRGGDAAARVWWERALATTEVGTLDRAELLEPLGRNAEAIPIVETLLAAAPNDRHLAAMLGRLLIASGNPGRARRVLNP